MTTKKVAIPATAAEAEAFLMEMPLSAISRTVATEHFEGTHVYPWNDSPMDGHVYMHIYDRRTMEQISGHCRTYHNGSRENGSPYPNDEVYFFFREMLQAVDVILFILYAIKKLGRQTPIYDEPVEETFSLSEKAATFLQAHPEWITITEYEDAQVSLTKHEEGGKWDVSFMLCESKVKTQ